MMREGFAVHIPTPPPFHNKGNWIFSLSQLGRYLADQAEELGAMLLPETDAQTLLVSDGAVRGVRTGDKGLDRDRQPGPSYEPGAEIHARATVLSEGTQGHLAMAAGEHFGLPRRNPQIYSLGVKEVWRVAKPLDRVVHTLGWPLRASAKSGESGGSFIYPMGEDMVAIGFVVGLDYHDASLSPHDLLQQFKTHKLIRPLLEGGERIAWGAKTIPEGGLLVGTRSADGSGRAAHRRLGRIRQRAQAQGRSLRHALGHAGGRDDLRAAQGGRRPGGRRRARRATTGAYARATSGATCTRCATCARRSTVGSTWVAVWPAPWISPGGRSPAATSASSATPRRRSRSGPRDYPEPDGKLTFDKLSSVFLSGNRTRDDQPNHVRIAHRVPREVGEAWVAMCPAQVYEIAGDAGRRHRRGRADPVQLRSVRRDHRQGRPPDAARRRQRPRVQQPLTP